MIASIGEILFDVFPDKKIIGGAPFNFIYHVNMILKNGIFISRVGNDPFGREIMELLKNLNISPGFIQKDDLHPTGTAHVKINLNGEPEFTIDENCAYDHIQQSPGVDFYLKKNIQMLYFGTLAQRSPVTRNTIRSLWNSNIKFFYDVNIRQHFFSREIIEDSLRKADIVKVNYPELNLIDELILQGQSKDLIDGSVKRLMEKYKIKLFCVTMGQDGAWLFDRKDANHFKVRVDNVCDSVGAGDAYSAILAIGFLLNWDLEKINCIASNFAAGICRIKGAIPDKSFYSEYEKML